MIDRVNGPTIQAIEIAEFPSYEKHQLSNGMDLYMVNGGTQSIFKLDVIFWAGRRYETKHGVARLCASLLKEGIEGKTADELSELWDYYGALVSSYSDLDTAGASLTGLNRHAGHLIPNWMQMLYSAQFPVDELDHRKKIFAEKLSRELSKNDVVAYRLMTEYIYGPEHYYGYNTIPEDYLYMQREDLVQFYKDYYGSNRGFAILSGKISPEIEALVKTELSKIPAAKIPYEAKMDQVNPALNIHSGSYNHPTDNKLQAAIKLGYKTIPRSHPDYTAFYFLVQIFGGYFGSRLMKNLREEKGLCYNIYASIDRLKSSNYFYISAEVDSNQAELSLEEIRKEFEHLKTHLIDDQEIDMVKSYIRGKLLAGLDGPFRSSQLLKSYLSHELQFDYFCQFTNNLSLIDAELLMKVANKYFDWSKMTQVIVGP